MAFVNHIETNPHTGVVSYIYIYILYTYTYM